MSRVRTPEEFVWNVCQDIPAFKWRDGELVSFPIGLMAINIHTQLINPRNTHIPCTNLLSANLGVVKALAKGVTIDSRINTFLRKLVAQVGLTLLR